MDSKFKEAGLPSIVMLLSLIERRQSDASCVGERGDTIPLDRESPRRVSNCASPIFVVKQVRNLFSKLDGIVRQNDLRSTRESQTLSADCC